MELGKGSDNHFGNAGEIHSSLIAVIWSPIVDITILMAFYSYRRYAIIVHGVSGLTLSLFTVITGFSILDNNGGISVSPTKIDKYSLTVMNRHFLLGVVSLSFILWLMVLGICARVLNILQIKSIIVIYFKKIHMVFGYIGLIISKI
jgi:hypothetical protein